ncbi:MAG TPA: EscU/YscU/HrcU family type III secretion system export apparatus switch protein [Pirellulales bacterium]|nr:EscU/YscU/HrcU family type III secretion system export apparatus switch protein [Pirellulales bacterium]
MLAGGLFAGGFFGGDERVTSATRHGAASGKTQRPRPESPKPSGSGGDDEKNGEVEKPQKPAIKPPPPEFDRAPWRQADFLMVNPTHYAISLQEVGDDEYRLTSKAEGEEATLAIESAHDGRVPIIARDRALTRRIYRAVEKDETLPAPLALEVSRLYCHQEFVPETGRFVAFKELRDNELRVGFLLDEQSDFVTFRELSLPEEERVQRAQILPGTLKTDVRERDLRDSKYVDWLDYCIYNVCRNLRSPKGEKTHVHLVADGVKVDISDAEVGRAIEDYERERGIDATNAASRGSVLHQMLGELAREPERRSEKRLLKQLRRAHEEMSRLKESLDGELRSRLTRLRVPLLEREEIDSLLAERTLAEEHGDQFRRREERIDPERHTSAGYERLFCASHKLITQIRWPRDGGMYELDMRLVDANDGRVLWSDQGDRFDAEENRPIEQIGRPLCLPAGGTLVAASFSADPESSRPSGSVQQPFAPLHNAMFDRRTLDSEQLQGKTPCLLQLLPSTGSEMLDLRDLFGWQRCTIPAKAVTTSKPVTSLADVPANEELRYLVWRIAKASLPPAGDILSIERSRLTVGLGRNDGIAPTDRLLILRRGTDGASEEILTGEPAVSQVNDHNSVAVLEPQHASILQPGDMVVVKRPLRPRVAVFPAQVTAEDERLLRGISVMNAAQRNRLQQWVELQGGNLSRQLRAGLESWTVPLIEGESLARLAGSRVNARNSLDAAAQQQLARESGASHAVFLTIGPAKAAVPCRCLLTMTIVDVERKEVADHLRFELSPGQFNRLNQWRP